MDRAEFEANLRREGYELREGEIKPNEHRGSHAREFDARLFVLEGSINTVVQAHPPAARIRPETMQAICRQSSPP